MTISTTLFLLFERALEQSLSWSEEHCAMSDNLSESELLARIMKPHETEGWNRLQYRSRQMGEYQKDELMLFCVLEQVCRDSPEMGASFGLEAVNPKIVLLSCASNQEQEG